MAGRRRVRPDDDGAAVADAPQVRLTHARQQAAVGAVTGVAQTVANGPAAEAAAAAASAKLQQTEHEAEAVRKLAEEYPDALVVEAADFGKHGIVAPSLRVALICRACVRVRANKAEFKDDRRQAKVYVARRFAEEAAAHFDTCFSRNLEREHAMRQAAGVSPSPTPARGHACSRPQQQRQQQEKLLARLSYWFVEHNASLMAVSQFGKEIGSQLGELLPLNVDWSRRLHAAAKESYAATLARTIEMPYTCLAFDAGKWQHTGQHMLICVAANPNGVMVLPPVTQESAWTAESTAKVVSQYRLALQGTTIKHAVVDGAAYNDAAVDGMNILAEFIHELGDDPMSAHVPGLTPHEKDFVDAMGTALRGASYGCIKQVLCLGHWVKNRVVQAQDKDAASYKFLLNIERSLYGGEEDQSTRRTSLTSRIRAIRARVKEDGIAAIDEAIEGIKALLNPSTLVVTLQWRSAVANQVRRALKTPAKVVVADADGVEVVEPGAAQAPVGVEVRPAEARAGAPGAIDPAAGVGFDDESDEDKLLWTLQTGANWMDEAKKLRDILIELRAVAEGESTAARTATVNQTRWHTSTYLAYVFAAQNLQYLRLFYNRQASAPQSVKDIRADLADATKSALIQRELVEYTVSMAPASRFLQAASENSPGLVMRMWPLLRTLCDELLLQPANSVGRRCGNVIETFLNFEIGSLKDEFTRTVNFFIHAHLLVPGVFITLAETFLAKLDLSVRKVRFHLGFTEEELPEAEWEGFLNFQRLQKVPCDTLSFWRGPNSEKWPELRKIALYLYYAPAVVTTCDSIISVMGNMFSTRQTRLAESTAADLVAWRCNGHPGHDVDGSIRRNTMPGV